MDYKKCTFNDEGEIAKFRFYYYHVSMRGKSDEDKVAEIIAYLDGSTCEFYYYRFFSIDSCPKVRKTFLR